MPVPSEDADGVPLRPIALAIWALITSAATPGRAEAFDPNSGEVLQAYSAPLTAPKQEAARAGLNVLLPKLLAFHDLLPSVASTGGGFFGGGFESSIVIGWSGSGGLAGYASTFLASSDADLAALGTPVLLSNAILQLGASFATDRDFVIGPAPALIDTNGSDLAISGTLTAHATLTKSGAGTLALSGGNLWSAAPIVEAGTLKGPAASLQTPITNDATVEFAQAADGVYGFVIDGSGTVRKTGAGTLTLSGANAYAGASVIEQGRVALLGAGRLGAGPVSIAAGATLDLSAVGGERGIGTLSGDGAIVLGEYRLETVSATDTTFAGVVSGTGHFGKGGGGRLTLTAAHGYTGATLVTEGTLALAGAGRLHAQSALRMNAGATFDLSAADGARTLGSLDGDGTVVLGSNALTVGTDSTNTAFAGTVMGSGALIKTGSGTLTLTGETQHSGTTHVAQGTLLVRARSLGPTVVNDATLAFLETRSPATLGEVAIPPGNLYAVYPELYVYSGAIAGSGQVVKRGSGALWLRGENSYRGGTLIEDGILLGNDRSLQGAIVVNSGLAFYQAADGTYAGNTSGSGILLKYGPGNLTLAGINTHSGGTAFSGFLTIADDRNLGAANAAVIIAGGTLRATASVTSARPFGIAPDGATFDTQAHSVTLTGPVSGPGALTKTGSGTLSLSGAHSFTGGTHVHAGTLALEGSLASGLWLAPGARLTGTGTVAAPLSLAPDATFAARVDASGNASHIGAQSAQIDGAVLQVIAEPGQYRPRTDYTILTTSAGLSGRFAQATVDLPYLTPQLQYGPNSVRLTLSRNDRIWQSTAHTSSQRAVAGALERLAASTDADVQVVADTLNGLSAAQARAAFDSIAGAGRAQVALAQQSAQRAVAQQASARLGAAEGRLVASGSPLSMSSVRLAFEDTAQSDARAVYAAALPAAGIGGGTEQSRHGFWLRGFGGSGHIDGNDGAGDAKLRFGGIIGGYDQSVGQHMRLGLLAAYSKPRLTQGDPDTRNEAPTKQLALYGRYRDGPLRLDATVGIGAADIDGRRDVRAGGLARTASSDYDARSASIFIEAGYAMGAVTVFEPVFGLEWSRQKSDSYTESGAGALNLTEPERTIHSLRSMLGARVLHPFQLGESRATLESRAAWAHQFRSQASISTRFAVGGPETAFATSTLDVPKNSAILGLGLSMQTAKMLDLYLDVSSEVSSGQRVHAAGLGMRYRW